MVERDEIDESSSGSSSLLARGGIEERAELSLELTELSLELSLLCGALGRP
jgi:hypothetical protein